VKSDFDWPPVTRTLYEAVAGALDEDLDTPLAVALLFEALSEANTMADSGNVVEARHLARAVSALFGALGLVLRGSADHVDEASQALVERRDEARNAQNWAEADRLRDELVARGWTVEDSAAGTLIRRP
jgi:cysteinyl-tRNA synthetase